MHAVCTGKYHAPACYHCLVTRILNNFTPEPLQTVFLDRDGVINHKMPEGSYVQSLADFRLLDGAVEAITRLKLSGLRVCVVTNQRGISRGLYTLDDVAAIHAHLQEQLARQGVAVDAFFCCPHGKECTVCRKPNPGMFEQARARFADLSAASSVMIGDSKSDIEFGQRLGMKTIFIHGDPAVQRPGAEQARQLADRVSNSLREAVDLLVID